MSFELEPLDLAYVTQVAREAWEKNNKCAESQLPGEDTRKKVIGIINEKILQSAQEGYFHVHIRWGELELGALFNIATIQHMFPSFGVTSELFGPNESRYTGETFIEITWPM